MPNLQWFIVPRYALYLLHHVFDGFEEVRTLDLELVLWRLGFVLILLRNSSDHNETVPRPLFAISHERARLRDDLGSSVPVLPTSPSCVVIIDALNTDNAVSAQWYWVVIGRTLIFKLGGGATATVVCCDFASAVSVLTESPSSCTTAGDFSPELGPAEDEGERKIVETRLMAVVEGRWGLEGFRGEDWRHAEGFYTGVATISDVYSFAHIHSYLEVWRPCPINPRVIHAGVIEPGRS